MNAETGILVISIIGAVGTAANVYLMLAVSRETIRLKLWTRENFVAKDDMSTYLSPLKDAIQLRDSANRLNRAH